MEDILNQLSKDATGARHSPIRKACQETLELLQDESVCDRAEPYQLRERCLAPLQLALESRSSKLTAHAICGIQRLLIDEPFQSSLESDCEDQWLPMQVLNAVWATPQLPDETQVEVMKLLLNMTFTTTWCMNAKVITKISELYFAALSNATKQSLRSFVIKNFLRTLNNLKLIKDLRIVERFEVVLDTYGINSQASVRTAVKATLTQLLTAMAEKLKDKQLVSEEEANNAISEFTSNAENAREHQSLTKDVVGILTYLCDKLVASQSGSSTQQVRQMEPLLLEGILAVLAKVPSSLNTNEEFVDLVWQKLCPALICILGNPMTDKSVTSQKGGGGHDELGRGSGCSTSAPTVHGSSAKSVYNIAVELVRLVGQFESLRPVLESVFHRMLLYPPPQHRLDALKAIKEILNKPARLVDLAGPTTNMAEVLRQSPKKTKKKLYSELGLLKLILDSIQECCHCQETAVCITSVNLVNDLLTSVEQLVRGQGISEQMIIEIHKFYMAPEDGPSLKSTFSEDPDTVFAEDCEHSKDYPHSRPRNSSETHGDIYSKSDSDSDSEDGNKVTAYRDKKNTDSDFKTIDERARNDSSTRLYAEEEIKDRYLGTRKQTNFEELERTSARIYVKELTKILPAMLDSYSTLDADELIQRFSSDICTVLTEQQDGSNGGAILNADGVYLATYSALLLNVRLINVGYYHSEEKSLPISEQQFIDGILNTGLLLYLSRAWLSEVFHHVILGDLLGQAGFRNIVSQDAECALIQLLTDVDGLESRKIGGQLMTPFQNCADNTTADRLSTSGTTENTLAVDAGMKFAHRIVLVCWDGILDVLSVLINGKSSCGITSSFALMFNAKEESRRAREAICTSLDGLQKAARLACILGVQNRCGTVFEQLASGSCVLELEDLKRERERPEKKAAIPSVLANKPRLARLHAAHALSMDIVLGIGLEMGSHSEDCWQHVFRCCAHIAELEHTYFSRGNNQSNLPKVQQELPRESVDTSVDGMELSVPDIYTPVMAPVAPSINVPELIHMSSMEAGWDNAVSGGGVLSAAQASKILCGLSQEVDRLFEDSAHKLNMKALVSFLTELCKASQQQLASYGRSGPDNLTTLGGGGGGPTGPSTLPTNALHLYRLGDVMLKCLHDGRPLLHTMRAWGVVAPHFVEAACHYDHNISKKAVNCIHEVVTTLLSTHPELPHFHFNESLCKPFENLLCLELCDGDVQDQVVCSICELVEACTSEIKSGWRPLFGALRAVKIEYTLNEEVNEARQRHIAAVLDVFNVFLNTDNVLVFSNAAVDCILCLLKYIRGPGEFEEEAEDDSDSGSDLPGEGSSENLCLPALRYLKQCCSILSDMWQMPACPIFNGAHRIKTDAMRCVDPIIANMDLIAFQKPFIEKDYDLNQVPTTLHTAMDSEQSKSEEKGADAKSLTSLDSGIGVSNAADSHHITPHKEEDKIKVADIKLQRNTLKNQVLEKLIMPLDNKMEDSTECVKPDIAYHCETMEELDNHTGVLHVWFLVIEGMASTVVACPKNYQPQILETLFDLMRSAAKVPGPAFALHCVNHLLLPTLQSWLRRGNQLTGYWDSTTTANFKQCAGLCTDLVVEYIVQCANSPDNKASVEFLLKQLLDVLTECVAQANESISRLGCACIRHCLLSSGPMLTERMWQIAAVSLKHAFDVTMYCMKQLMTPFQANSDNFYGDIGQVKVAVRKDCSGIECERLRLLAQQVFLLDSQRGTSGVIDYEREEDRSYIFLIYPPEQKQADEVEPQVTRVPFKSVVVGLLSHQLLVQTVGCLLIQGSSNMVPCERSMMPSSPHGSRQNSFDQEDNINLIQDTLLPGMLKFMSSRNVLTLLQCLKDSYQMAADFDARPGLKFLIQKVARAEVAANMYKQACISLTFYIHTLIEICAHQDNICVENTNSMIYECIQYKRGKSGLESSNKSGQTTVNEESVEDQTVDQQAHSPEGLSEEPPMNPQEDPLENQPPGVDTFSQQLELAKTSSYSMQKYMTVFTNMMREIFEEVCTDYVDLYIDQEGPNAADRLSGQVLVFLVAQPDDFPTLKREKSLKEMVAEKLKARNQQNAKINAAAKDAVTFSDIVQATPVQAGSEDEYEDEEERNSTPTSPQKEKQKNDTADKVYTVATDKTIKSLMTQYKRRKQTHSMPTFVKQGRSKPAPVKKQKPPSSDPVERQIEEQQQRSILKDSEAHLTSWIEMIANILQLFHQLPDYQYKALLPIIFNCVNQFICHCKAQRLRGVLGQWTHRIGHLYGFAPPGDQPPPKPRPEP